MVSILMGLRSLVREAEKSPNKQANQINLQLHVLANVMKERSRGLRENEGTAVFTLSDQGAITKYTYHNKYGANVANCIMSYELVQCRSHYKPHVGGGETGAKRS